MYTLQQGRVNDAVKGWGTIGVKRYFGNGCGGADEHITKQLEVGIGARNIRSSHNTSGVYFKVSCNALMSKYI